MTEELQGGYSGWVRMSKGREVGKQVREGTGGVGAKASSGWNLWAIRGT